MPLDPDGFKAVNNRLGHAAGDELLRQIAGRLDEVTRQGGVLARLGGDEFAIIVSRADAGSVGSWRIALSSPSLSRSRSLETL